MKRFKIDLLSIVSLAIVSALITKGENNIYFNGFKQTSTCTPVITECNNGPLICAESNIYANQQSSSTCINLLMHRNP